MRVEAGSTKMAEVGERDIGGVEHMPVDSTRLSSPDKKHAGRRVPLDQRQMLSEKEQRKFEIAESNQEHQKFQYLTAALVPSAHYN